MSWFARRGAAPAASPSQPQPALQFGGPDGGQGSRSLELVRYNTESGKFELGAEALAVLRGTRGPVGVVAVAGRARQGKSFILNQLLGRSGGFEVGPTHRPCTKGLWMWSAPVERTAADGSSYSLVLLDTEGIDAYDQVRTRLARRPPPPPAAHIAPPPARRRRASTAPRSSPWPSSSPRCSYTTKSAVSMRLPSTACRWSPR
jgi:hypothetical protein